MILQVLALASQLQAVAVPSRPAEVTVFPDGARIIRKGEAELPQGPVTVSFSGVPQDANEASLRLSVEGPKGTKLFGVRFEPSFSEDAQLERRKELELRIRALNDDKADVSDRIAARKAESEILKALGEKAAGGALYHAQGAGSFANETALAGKRLADLMAASRKDEREVRKLDEKIAVLNQEMASLNSGRNTYTASADLELPSAGPTRFELSYNHSSARWNPVYDLRLDSGGDKPKVDLSFAAEVRQWSGENWNDVKLVLSTARPQQATEVPDPTNWWLDFEQVLQYAPQSRRSKGARPEMMSAPAAAPMGALGGGGGDYGLEEAQVETAQAIAAEFSTLFSIKRLMDIPSDKVSHRVPVAESSHQTDLKLVVVPRLQQAAFIEAEVKYSGEQPLLPGPAQLFRDGDFVGRTQVRNTGPGETFKLGFGQDERVKVERELLKQQKSDNEGFIFTKGRRVYHWVTKIKNLHAGARNIEVREQLPRSRQKDISVSALELKPKALPPDESKPGLTVWDLKLEPKAEEKITFRYEVKFPDDKRVIGME